MLGQVFIQPSKTIKSGNKSVVAQGASMTSTGYKTLGMSFPTRATSLLSLCVVTTHSQPVQLHHKVQGRRLQGVTLFILIIKTIPDVPALAVQSNNPRPPQIL